MKINRFTVMAIAGLLAAGAANAAGSIFITEPGADGFTIDTKGFNGSSYDITKLTFDFTSSHTTDGSNIVIDGAPFSIVAPVGGSATFFGSGAVFGFTFTGLSTFEKFSFTWDPDSAINGSYGATGLDFIDATVTAETTGGTYFGSFALVGHGPDVSAVLSPVPESGTMAMTFGGLAIAASLLARRRAPKA